MKNLRILGLALVAVFALGAIAVSSASAAPTYNECVKASPKNTGKYTDKTCGTEAPGGNTGAYNLKEGLGKPGKNTFKGKSGASELIVVVPAGVSKEFPGGATVEIKCASSKDSGTVQLPNKSEKVTAEFKKCKALGSPCQSGAKKETIQTNSLAGELLDIEGGSGVGAELGAEGGPTSPLAHFTCTELATTNVIGSLISEQTGDINVAAKEFVDHFVVGPGLGEVEYAPGAKYTPIVNIPTKKTGGVNGEHFLNSEISKEKVLTGTLPSGQTQEVEVKGENLEIQP